MKRLLERRGGARVHHDSIAELCDDAGRSILADVRLIDVSASGACFASTRTFTPGRRLRVRLRSLREGPRDVRGKIAWVERKRNAFYYGIRFDAQA